MNESHSSSENLPGILAGAQNAGPSFLWTPAHQGDSSLQMYAPLLFWLTEQLDPAAYVTLGAHGSPSHLAVCQAVRALGKNTRCYAISGTAEPLHPAVREEHDRLYSGFSKLLPAGWDEDGVQHFRCGAIDWLQVDGEQELEQLRANWRSWRRRLSARAIVTIHGLKSDLLQAQSGWIHRLQNCHAWAEFHHGEGLLMLAVGENQSSAQVQWLFQALQSQPAPLLQALFERLGLAACKPQAAAAPQPVRDETAQAALEAAREDARQYGARAGLLQAQLQAAGEAGKAAHARADELAARLLQAESSVRALEQELQEAKGQLQQQARRLEDRFRELGQLTRMVDEREKELRDLRQQLAQPAAPAAARPLMTAMTAMTAVATPVAAAPAREALPLALQAQLIAQSGLFDETWYRQAYPDVAAAGFAPIDHYLQYGAAERRNPSAAFDTAWYCRRYPEAAASGLNPLVHYIRFGRERGVALRPRAEPSHA